MKNTFEKKKNTCMPFQFYTSMKRSELKIGKSKFQNENRYSLQVMPIKLGNFLNIVFLFHQTFPQC